jgi:DNA polymerase sigma
VEQRNGLVVDASRRCVVETAANRSFTSMQAREVTLNTSDVDVSVFADANGWRGMFS